MIRKVSAISKFYLLILSMIPFGFLGIGYDNPKFISSYLIWVGVIFLINPVMLFEAFREMIKAKGYKFMDEDPDDFEGMKGVYGCLGTLGGLFLLVIGIITTFILE